LQKNRLLIIDDEQESREAFQELLSRNFEVYLASDGAQGLEVAKQVHPDVMMVDIQMEGLDGISVCKLVRRTPELKCTPIIMVSAFSDENWRTESFLWGADDFIAKPFSSSELMARILAKLCWVRQPKDELLNCVHHCGNLHLDQRKLEATIDGKIIQLTPFEFNLLKFFVSNREQILSRERLLSEVWHDSVVTHRTVDTHVYTLRKKLQCFDYEFRTIHGAGYILKPRSV
jgi:two-component system alkaline phosphatase synthesis response regulator PhoP